MHRSKVVAQAARPAKVCDRTHAAREHRFMRQHEPAIIIVAAHGGDFSHFSVGKRGKHLSDIEIMIRD